MSERQRIIYDSLVQTYAKSASEEKVKIEILARFVQIWFFFLDWRDYGGIDDDDATEESRQSSAVGPGSVY